MAEAKTNGHSQASASANGSPSPLVVRRRATPLEITRIAARAEVSPNTVRNYLAGRPGYSTTHARIAKALIKCGLPALVRAAAV